MCKFLYICVYWAVSVTIISLTIIAVDRYCVVMLTKRNLFTTNVLPYIIPLIWAAGFVFASPQLISRHHLHYRGRRMCIERWYNPFHPRYSRQYYNLVLLVMLYFIPLSAMTIMYTAIGLKLSKEIKSQQTMHGNQQERSEEEIEVNVQSNLMVENNHTRLTRSEGDRKTLKFGFNKQRVIRMLVSIVICFALCWFPIHLLQLIQTFHPYYIECPGAIPSWAPYVAYFMYYGNGALNPVLYFIFSRTYRKGLKNSLRKSVWFPTSSIF